MFKKQLIGIASKRHKKRNKQGAVPGYREANAIGILVNAADPVPSNLDELLEQFRAEGKQADILYIGDATTEVPHQKTLVTENDFSMLGEPRGTSVKNFLQLNYDFLIILDHQGHHLTHLIGALCQAKCRMGYVDYPYEDLLNIQLKPTPGNELEDVAKYLKMIRND